MMQKESAFSPECTFQQTQLSDIAASAALVKSAGMLAEMKARRFDGSETGVKGEFRNDGHADLYFKAFLARDRSSEDHTLPQRRFGFRYVVGDLYLPTNLKPLNILKAYANGSTDAEEAIEKFDMLIRYGV